MKPFSIFTGLSSSWLGSLASCCVPSPRQPHQAEKDLPVWSDDAGYTPPASRVHLPGQEDSWSAQQRMQWPGAAAEASSTAAATAYAFAASGPEPRSLSQPRTGTPSQSCSRSHSRRSQSRRRRLLRGHGMSASLPIFSLSSSPVRRLKISPPTNFRHLHSDSFVFSPAPTRQPEQIWPGPQARPPSLQLLELNLVSPSISSPGTSPVDENELTRPLRVHARSNSTGSTTAVGHERSYSSMSFHVPRRQLPQAEGTGSPLGSQRGVGELAYPAPAVPPRSRLRSFSSPVVESMVERIASAMIEMEILQADIDSVMERQSLYVNSRPTTANGFVFDPMLSMLSMPPMPPVAPSFAERLSTERPQTASSRSSTPVAATPSMTTLTPAPLALPVRNIDRSLPKPLSPPPPPPETALTPPLPLVLRPPLRKKKSFSQVSRWLFASDSSHMPEDPQQHKHSREISLDSVTNLPRPVTTKDGFYQCVVPASLGAAGDRNSMDAVSTVETLSTWTTEREQDERRRLEQEGEEEEEEQEEEEVTWSPRQETLAAIPTTMDMLEGRSHRPQSVGVAF